MNNISECKKIQPFISNCSHLTRLIESLKYVEKLDVVQNKKDEMEFVRFCLETNKEILNDTIHLINEHGQDLEEIHQSLINDEDFPVCDLAKCSLTSRHYNRAQFNKKNEKNVNNDECLVHFFIEIMDKLHFYLNHLFDLGLRSIKHDDDGNEADDKKQDEKEHINLIDAEFKRMIGRIEEKKKKYGNFDRFESTKFNISVGGGNKEETGIYFHCLLFCDLSTLSTNKNIQKYHI